MSRANRIVSQSRVSDVVGFDTLIVIYCSYVFIRSVLCL